jgi:tetratricopeptide (TPR) repeat protein
LPYFQRAIAEFAGYYEAYDRIGAADLKLWRIPEAEEAYRMAIRLSDGLYAHSLLALGAILDDQKQFVEAESVTRKGLELNPDSWSGHFYLGLALFGLNRMEDAESSIYEALRCGKEFPEAYLVLADIHGRKKDYRSLKNDLNDYLRLASDSPANARVKARLAAVQYLMVASQNATAPAQPQP